MNRLIVFSFLMISIISILTLRNYKGLAFSNDRFDLKKEETAYKAHLAELEELAKLQMPKKKIIEEEKPKAFVVVLDTPELERGHALYKKCIVCHGKLGEGKKSQNSPRIGGQFEWYLEKQITNIQQGVRVNQKMMPYVKRLSPQDIKDISAYLAKIPWDN